VLLLAACVPQVVKRMCPECKVSQVPHSGPSPVLIRPHELALVAPDWEKYSAWIEDNEHARNVFGEGARPHEIGRNCCVDTVLLLHW
jgi:hypothetical protein